MTTEILEKRIAYLADGFSIIDWKEPFAHEVYREFSEVMELLLVDPERVSWHEFNFWELGCNYGIAKRCFETIPPLSVHKEKTEGQ